LGRRRKRAWRGSWALKLPCRLFSYVEFSPSIADPGGHGGRGNWSDLGAPLLCAPETGGVRGPRHTEGGSSAPTVGTAAPWRRLSLCWFFVFCLFVYLFQKSGSRRGGLRFFRWKRLLPFAWEDKCQRGAPPLFPEHPLLFLLLHSFLCAFIRFTK
jgi:hypothetical protein